VKRAPLVKYLSTSTFHAQHHQNLKYNFGFYTLVWDHLFGTLSPRYEEDFGRVPVAAK
jgi:sterol desaturase/sphingolipid hydroxylase (fatty acid hydroxylase superfamily)